MQKSRTRTDTEPNVRVSARRLLVEHGRHAVTLRAIARDLGITAPALYRYYGSREDLLNRLCDDICGDLADELTEAIAAVPAEAILERALTACRAFRRWALAHPTEFELVFATPDVGHASRGDVGVGTARPEHDRFARVFLRLVLPLFTDGRLVLPPVDVPAALLDELGDYRRAIIEAMAEEGVRVEENVLPVEALYLMIDGWTRLHGHVALEAFGQLSFAFSDAEPLFEAMLTRMVREFGLTG
ncbi:TetR/AcrR family transcriptional regulator [Herbihabitans rhizosphaerae]|nr:TetR/AcrR family transcriptional regulator [Herbihabitans rhizosphaerae]